MRRFEFTGDGSNKFWAIEQDGSDVRVQFGKIGTAGQTQEKSFADVAAATQELDSLVNSKLRKGYTEVTAGSAGGAAPKASSTAKGASKVQPASTAKDQPKKATKA